MWEVGAALQEWVGRYAGRSLVIAGNGRCVWEDLSQTRMFPYGQFMSTPGYVPRIATLPDVMAVNDIGVYLPVLTHWVSFHDDVLVLQNEVRYRVWPDAEQPLLHGNTRAMLGRQDRRAAITEVVPVLFWEFTEPRMFSSGGLAVCIAHMLGYSEIILAGMPADCHGNLFAHPSETSRQGIEEAHDVWTCLKEFLPDKGARVRSMSGFTRALFGAPDGCV